MKQISYETLESWKSSGKDYHLIDVREDYEHSMFNIGGTLIPLGDIISRKDDFNIKGMPVVVYCKRGIRSQIAIQRLQTSFPDVDFCNLDGGIFHLI